MTAQQYGRYEIKSELGQGGMATVYLAHDPRFGRDVALKVMSLALRDDPAFRGRFEREARTVATLEHPAIVPVYDFGEDHAQLYLVMRHMAGGSLADRIVRRPLTPGEIVPIFRRVGAALDHAHQQGSVHRDLKPGNILFDQYNNAFLSDFGIVKLAQGTTDLTGSGVIGTPAYMSPEQIHGEQELDGRSDIYTLGIILFESLTGRKPYRAETPVKQMMAHVLDPIPSILEANPNLPPDCEPLVQKALAKEREARFRSASELTDALTITMTGLQPSLPPVERQEPATETAELDTMTAVPPVSPHPPMSSSPISSSPYPPVPILITPPPPEEEPPTYVGMAALTFEKPSPRPPVASPVKGKRPPLRRPFAWLGLLIVLLLVLAAGLALSRSLSAVWSSGTPAALVAPPATRTATSIPTPSSSIISATASERPSSEQSPLPPALTPAPQLTEIGLSAAGTPIVAARFGNGEKVVVFVGGLHAGFAPGSVTLAEEAIEYFREHPEQIPTAVSLYILPNANPDSTAAPAGQLAGRLNGNGVDLNRNWDCRWTADPPWGSTPQPGLGGSAPFSEPEVQALADFIQQQAAVTVVFWQARASQGLSSPGACAAESAVSGSLAQTYGRASDYAVADFERVVDQVLNGDATNWLDSQGIPAISVLLPNYNESDFAHNLPAMLAVLEAVASNP